MKIFVNYNKETGEIKGFYTTDIHNEEDIPQPYIEITKEEWQNALKEQGAYKVDIENESLIYDPYIPTLEEEKTKSLNKIRNLTGKLINNRYKPFDRENLFVLQNKEDIKDYLTGNRATATEVKENIQSIRNACNAIEQEIEEVANKEELELIKIDKDTLKEKAGWI